MSTTSRFLQNSVIYPVGTNTRAKKAASLMTGCVDVDMYPSDEIGRAQVQEFLPYSVSIVCRLSRSRKIEAR
jgi:hypothetical protein